MARQNPNLGSYARRAGTIALGLTSLTRFMLNRQFLRSSARYRLSPTLPSGALGVGALRLNGTQTCCGRFDLIDALLAQDLLNALDRVAVGVQQRANAPQQLHVLRAIVAPAAAPLHRPDLRKPAFPEPQDVLRNAKLASNFANRAKRFGRLVHRVHPSGCHAVRPLWR